MRFGFPQRAGESVRLSGVLMGLALLLTTTSACTGTHGTTPVARAKTLRSLTVAVQASNGRDLTIYRVDRTGVAHKVAALLAPTWARDSQIQLAAGTDPRMCVIWSNYSVTTARAAKQVRCYDHAGDPGMRVPAGNARDIALSADGRKLLTATDSLSGLRQLTLWDIHGPRPALVSRADLRSLADQDDCYYIDDVAWIGDSDVALSCLDSGQTPGIRAVVTIDALMKNEVQIAAGIVRPTGAGTRGYNDYDQLIPVPGNQALAVLSHFSTCAMDYCPGPKHPRLNAAVRLNTADGTIAQKLSLPGESVYSISGGPDGVVYTVDYPGHPRTYVRWPGASVSTLVVGLPRPYENDMSNRETTAQP